MTSTLSGETVELFKSVVGKRERLFPLNRRATRDSIQRFALGVGDDNPLWWDDGTRDASRSVPPTFLYTGLNFGSWPDLGGGPTSKSQPTVTLWAGDSWTWNSTLKPDEAFGAESEILGAVEKTIGDRTVSLKQRERVTFRGGDQRQLASFVRSTVTMPHRTGAVTPAAPDARLSAEELHRVRTCYDEEPARRRGSTPRLWNTVAVGDAVGPMVKGPLTVTSLVGWAMGWGSPLCPTNRILHQWVRAFPDSTVVNRRTGVPEGSEGIHWDPDVFGALGYDRGFDFGPQRVSSAAHLCTDWCGDAGMLVKLDVKLLKPNYIGDVTWLSGTVTKSSRDADGRGLVGLAIEGRSQNGDLTTVATAVIELPLE